MNRKAGERAGIGEPGNRGQGWEKLTKSQGSGQGVVDRKAADVAGRNGQEGREKGRD